MAATRIVSGLIVAHAVLLFFPQSRLDSKLSVLSDGTWLGAFDRWDAHYYMTIAAHGYPAGTPDGRAFFPGYPVVVRAAHVLTGGVLSYPQTGCLVSFLAFAVAAGLLFHVVSARFGARTAAVATALFCWFPTSVFFMAPYSEALFTLEILAVVVLVDRGRWWWAAAVAGYASATSPESVALTLALFVAALVARRGLGRAVGYGVVGSTGAAAYVAYLGIRFGKPFDFAQVLPDFHRVAVVPLTGVVENVGAIHHALVAVGAESRALRPYSYNIVWMWLVDDLAAVLALAALCTLVVMVVRDRRAGSGPFARVPVAWLVVLGGIIVLATSTVIRPPGAPTNTEGTARLISVAVPLYAGSALMVRRWQGPVIVGLGLSAAAAFVTQVLFNLGYWVT